MNNPSLDSLLLTLLATQTPEAIHTEGGDRTVLTFSAHGAKVEVSRSWSHATWSWLSADPGPGEQCREFVWARIQPGWDLCTNSREVAEAFDECCRRTEPIKQAKIIAALKSITATP